MRLSVVVVTLLSAFSFLSVTRAETLSPEVAGVVELMDRIPKDRASCVGYESNLQSVLKLQEVLSERKSGRPDEAFVSEVSARETLALLGKEPLKPESSRMAHLVLSGFSEAKWNQLPDSAALAYLRTPFGPCAPGPRFRALKALIGTQKQWRASAADRARLVDLVWKYMADATNDGPATRIDLLMSHALLVWAVEKELIRPACDMEFLRSEWKKYDEASANAQTEANNGWETERRERPWWKKLIWKLKRRSPELPLPARALVKEFQLNRELQEKLQAIVKATRGK